MKFFKVLAATLALSFAGWCLLVWGEAGRPTKMSQWIYDAYEKKAQTASMISGRKIVIVAGSNALFGVDSKMLEKALGLPVVNDAVNAGIELPCILFMAQKVIGEGDIVLMPLEYPMYSYQGKPGVQMIDFLLAREPDCFWKLTLREQLYLLWHVSFERIWEGYVNSDNTPVNAGLYGAHHIDEYGDQTHTTLAERTEAMYAEVHYHTGHPEKYGTAFDREALGWKYLSAFTAWCRQHHVKVVFMPSTLMWHEAYEKNPKEAWFYSHIAEEIRQRGWRFVGDPYAYMYDASQYLNTNFHLIDSARKERTGQMIEDLRHIWPEILK